jgi:methylenetetrahydrofolate reductase (NADPH)
MSALNPAVGRALRRPRYEVIPLPGIVEEVAEHLPDDVQVTVTASPRRGPEATLEVCEQLAALGYQMVPHLAARMVAGREHLRELLDRLSAAGIDDVFVIAGDAPEPAGEFPDAHSLLTAMTELGDGIGTKERGIAGYPESHPFIPDDVTVQSMWDKRQHATYVVSQICFDARTVRAWVERVRRRGVTLPILLGVAGPVDPARLARMARKVGVGESARFLSGHRNWLTQLVRPRGYRPDKLLEALAPPLADPSGAAGLHLYTFNEVAKTERWRTTLLDRIEAAEAN